MIDNFLPKQFQNINDEETLKAIELIKGKEFDDIQFFYNISFYKCKNDQKIKFKFFTRNNGHSKGKYKSLSGLKSKDKSISVLKFSKQRKNIK